MIFTQEILYNNAVKNERYFQEKAPDMYSRLASDKEQVSIVLENGKLDAIYNNASVYGVDALTLSREQVKNFLMNPTLIYPHYRKNVIQDPNPKLISHKHGLELNKALGLEFKAPDIKKIRFIPYLHCVGVGFGFYLNLLLDELSIANILLIDTPAIFKLSFFTLDWEAIFNRCNSQGTSLYILLISDKSKNYLESVFSTDFIQGVIQRINPGNFHFGYVFEHIRHNPPISLLDLLHSKTYYRDLYLGYFDDELWSLEWTLEKIELGVPLLSKAPEREAPLPAVVVGSGPSLDRSIELLKEFQDRVVIFSCGSSITAMQTANIVPDFCVLTERTKQTYDLVKDLEPEFLKQVNLLTNNPLWTETLKLFGFAGIYLKPNDTGSTLFGYPNPYYLLLSPGPTVTAAGVALAAFLRFKELYLTGVDLGTRDTAKVHSSYSYYYKDGTYLFSIKNSKPPTSIFDVQMQDKNGNVVYTNPYLYLTKLNIEQNLSSYKDIKAFNLSRGLPIEGAQEIEPEEAIKNLKNLKKVSKRKIIEDIKACCETEYLKHINPELVLRRVIESFNLYIQQIENDFMKRDYTNHMNVAIALRNLIDVLGKTGDYTFGALIYHNTYQWSYCAMGRALELEGKELQQFMEFFWINYLNFMKEARGEVIRVYDRFFALRV